MASHGGNHGWKNDRCSHDETNSYYLLLSCHCYCNLHNFHHTHISFIANKHLIRIRNSSYLRLETHVNRLINTGKSFFYSHYFIYIIVNSSAMRSAISFSISISSTKYFTNNCSESVLSNPA